MFRSGARFAAAAAGGALGVGLSTASARQVYNSESPTAFDPDEWRKFRLRELIKVNHDTKIARFDMPRMDMKMGLSTSSCVVVRCQDEKGEEVVRPYTPISHNEDVGYFDLMIKKYPGGKVGTHVHSMVEGDKLDVKGPYQKFPVAPNQYSHIGMVAGGSGLTPLYQVINSLLVVKGDKTKLSLIFANNSPEDILLANQLKKLTYDSDRLRIYYVVKNAPLGWQGGIGYVTKEQLKAYMPAPGEGPVLVCGPPGLMKHVSGEPDYSSKPPSQGKLSGLLKELGYSESDVYKF